MDLRAFLTTTCGTGSGSSRSTSSATAPCATAASANEWPSNSCPTMQQNMLPALTRRESYSIERTSTFSPV